jgi:hypothetical protein
VTVVLVVVGVGAALFLLDRLALWMEGRGWLYWRHRRGSGAGSLGLLETIYQPSMVHVIEEESRQRTEADQDASGEPLPD